MLVSLMHLLQCFRQLVFFLYGYVYTPLKKKSSVAVLVGAFPGALPCLIGWVAATGTLNPSSIIWVNGHPISNAGGWILFGIQFLWQFPHFWAIAWVAHKDYASAGFKLLPSDKGPTKIYSIASSNVFCTDDTGRSFAGLFFYQWRHK